MSANPFEPPKASLDIPVDRAAPPLWNPDAAGAWSLLFSPVFGSVLLRKNWRALGETTKVHAGTVWIAVSILMLLVTILIGYLGVFYIAVWYFAWQKPQTVYIRERWGRQYPRKGWMMPLVCAFAAYVAVVAALVFVATLALKK